MGVKGVDFVVDCSGRCTTRAGVQRQVDRCARELLNSAPPETLADCNTMRLNGINRQDVNPQTHRINSKGGCIANALASPADSSLRVCFPFHHLICVLWTLTKFKK